MLGPVSGLNPQISPEEIRALRVRLQESRAVFGRRFDRGRRTVESWELGVRQPEGLVRLALVRLATRRKGRERA